MGPVFCLGGLLLPALCGGLLLLRPPKRDRALRLFAGGAMLLSAGLGWALLLRAGEGALTLVRFSAQLSLTLSMRGAGRFFAGIFSLLFPVVLLYADAYADAEPGRGRLFGGLLCAYAAALGCCMADNLCTLILFGELLSCCAFPLLNYHKTEKTARKAKKLLVFSLCGTVLTVTALVFLAAHGAAGSFAAPAGTLPQDAARVFYLLGFIGFGVKAAVFPLHFWLLGLSDAPTPSAAILEAVAVTNVGLLAILRLTFHSFGAEALTGSWAQTAVFCVSVFTLLFAAVMAVRQSSWKRKLAFSTIANISYALFSVSLMTAQGYTGALLHAAFHSCGKLLAFLCAGAVLQKVEKGSGPEFRAMGRRMPLTFAAYTIAAVSLVGVPPFCGFVGKWYILTAAADAQTVLAYVGAGALLIAALLAAIYLFINVCRAWFPPKEAELPSGVREAPRRMLVCFLVLSLCLILGGVLAQPIVSAALRIAGGG